MNTTDESRMEMDALRAARAAGPRSSARRSTSRGALLAVMAVAAVTATAHAEGQRRGEGSRRAADTECYDFTDLAAGTTYGVGDTVSAGHSTIALREFYVDGGSPSQLDESGGYQHALVQNSRLAQGSAPELRMVMTNATVTPDSPIRKVELKFAENTGGAGPISNLEVNGEKRVVKGGLIQANGKVLGNKSTGKAAVIVSYDTVAEGIGFNRGTLRLHATRGAIESWSIGGSSQFFLDDVCITR